MEGLLACEEAARTLGIGQTAAKQNARCDLAYAKGARKVTCVAG